MSKRPSNRFIAPADLTPENLLAVFKGAGMEAKLDGEVLTVTSKLEVVSWGDPKTGEMETIELGPYTAHVRIRSFPNDSRLVSMDIYNQTLDPGKSDMQEAILAYCNTVNTKQNFIRAYSYDDDHFAMGLDILASADGISTHSLVGALEVFFTRAGSIQAGAF